MNIVVHGMEGFDYGKAKEQLAIPAGYTIEAMFTIGKLGAPKILSEKLREQEIPSDRNPSPNCV